MLIFVLTLLQVGYNDPADKARTGADVKLTYTPPDGRRRTMYLQLKMLYPTYDSYYSSVVASIRKKMEAQGKISKDKPAPKDEELFPKDRRWDGFKSNWFDALYQSQCAGPDYGTFQLLGMQQIVADVGARASQVHVNGAFLNMDPCRVTIQPPVIC